MKIHVKVQGGFSTLEALIALVILAVVALGMAGMTAHASRQQKNAHALYRAALLLNDLGERVRSTQSSAIKGSYIAPLNYAAPVTGPSVDCFATACTADQTADFERQLWLQKVRAELPEGAASIEFTPATAAGVSGGGLYTVHLVWREVGVGNSASSPPKPTVLGGPSTSTTLGNDPACAHVQGLPAQQQVRCFTSRIGV